MIINWDNNNDSFILVLFIHCDPQSNDMNIAREEGPYKAGVCGYWRKHYYVQHHTFRWFLAAGFAASWVELSSATIRLCCYCCSVLHPQYCICCQASSSSYSSCCRYSYCHMAGSQMAPYSLHSALILTRARLYYIENRVPFGTEPVRNTTS